MNKFALIAVALFLFASLFLMRLPTAKPQNAVSAAQAGDGGRPVSEPAADTPSFEAAPPVHFDIGAISAEAEQVAQAVAPLYREMRYHEGYTSSYLPTEEQRRQVTQTIGDLGYPAVSDVSDMCNPAPVRRFCGSVSSGAADSLGIYSVGAYGTLTRESFLCQGGAVYRTQVDVDFGRGAAAVSPADYETELDMFYLSEKGFLFYGNDGLGWRGMKQGLRVAPLGQENRAAGQLYVRPLMGYSGHNILLADWDRQTIGELSFNDVFEMLYVYETGDPPLQRFGQLFSPDNATVNAVPAADFEPVMLKYFDLTAAQLREFSVYDPETGAYAWEMLLGGSYAPSWEVVGRRENTDGSLTLAVDGYSIPHAIERFATNYLTVMPRPDGSFFYVSNRIEYSEEGRSWKYAPVYYPRVKLNK